MSFAPLTWLRDRLPVGAGEAKSVTTIPLDALSEIVGGTTTSAGTHVSRERALQVTAALCAVRVIAEGVAQVPIRVVEETYRDDALLSRKAMHGHWAHRLLAQRPNNWQTSFQFREHMVAAAVLDRGGLAIKNTIGGEVRELLPVPMGCWSVEQRADWSLRFRVDFADKTHGYFDQGQVFFLTGLSLDGFSGLPILRLAREALGLAGALESQQSRLAARGGNPSGVLSFKDPLKPETLDRLRATWSEKYGPGGTGGAAILDQGATFVPMTMTGVDAQHLETRRMQIEEIGRAFRVLPIMLMQSDKAMTFASAEQMFRAHAVHTLGPWMRRFEEAATRDLFAPGGNLAVDLQERALLRGDFKDEAEYYAKALGTGGGRGWMTQNEVRAATGMNPLDDPEANRLPVGAMDAPITDPEGTAE